jgi:hypothetical protein
MNHHHRKTIDALFAHPISTNIGFKEVVRALEGFGAKIESKSGNRIGVTLGGHTAAFTHVNHDLPKEEVVQLRKFLTAAGVTPQMLDRRDDAP